MEDQKQENSVPGAVNSTSPTVEKTDAEKNKGIAMVAYIIFFIPLLAAKDSKFAMYHANQGLILFIVAMLANILLRMFPYFSWLVLGPVIQLGLLAFVIIGILNVSKGEMKPLPFIGGFQIIK